MVWLDVGEGRRTQKEDYCCRHKQRSAAGRGDEARGKGDSSSDGRCRQGPTKRVCARPRLRQAKGASRGLRDNARTRGCRQPKIVVRAVDAREIRAPVSGVHAPRSKQRSLVTQNCGRCGSKGVNAQARSAKPSKRGKFRRVGCKRVGREGVLEHGEGRAVEGVRAGMQTDDRGCEGV